MCFHDSTSCAHVLSFINIGIIMCGVHGHFHSLNVAQSFQKVKHPLSGRFPNLEFGLKPVKWPFIII